MDKVVSMGVSEKKVVLAIETTLSTDPTHLSSGPAL